MRKVESQKVEGKEVGLKVALLAGLILLSFALPALAQTQTSGEAAATDTGLVSKLKTYAEKAKDSDADDEPEGFYPRVGGLTTGSGLALGGGYRDHFGSRAFYADLSGVVSFKGYVGLDGRLRVPSPASWLELWATGAYRRFTQEDYFGLGLASLEGNRSDYAITSTDIGAEAVVKLSRRFDVGADIGYFRPTLKAGKDDTYPNTELLFSDLTAPGLAEQPDYLHYGLFAELDTRDASGNPKRGGRYRATLARWNDRTFDAYTFNRFDVDGAQYVPLFGSERHVLLGRAGASFVNNDTDQRVPFYVYPYVGGFTTLRSYTEFRFREENALFMSGEYRLGVHKYVQVLGFVDAAKVAHDWQDIDTADMKTGYGWGIRAGTERRTFISLTMGAGGDEGRQWFLKFMPSW